MNVRCGIDATVSGLPGLNALRACSKAGIALWAGRQIDSGPTAEAQFPGLIKETSPLPISTAPQQPRDRAARRFYGGSCGRAPVARRREDNPVGLRGIVPALH